MSILGKMNLDDIQPAELLDDGNYPCTTIYAGMKRSTKEGERPYINLMFMPDDYEDSDGFNGLLSFPLDDDPPRTERLLKTNLVEFCEAFGLDTTEFLTACDEALTEYDNGNEKVKIPFIIGSKGMIKVKTEPDQDGHDKNVADKYIK